MLKKFSRNQKIAIIAGIAMPLVLFKANKFWPDRSEQEMYQVSTTNQLGGITAGKIVVQYSKPARSLTDEDKEIISRILLRYPQRVIEVSTQIGSNNEPTEFAEQIKTFIKDGGFTVDPEISRSNFVKGDSTFNNVMVITEEPGKLVFGVLPQ